MKDNWLTIEKKENCVILTKCSWDAMGVIVIPEGVTHIGDSAFRGCLDVTSVTIPKSVIDIGERSFSCCHLEAVKVEDENTVYDSRENCNAIIESKTNTLLVSSMNTIIPNGVAAIGDDAFSCIDVTSIVIPDSVVVIGKEAFKLSGLTSITIPHSVTAIGKGAFSFCRNLETIQVEDGNEVYDSRNNCNAIIESKTNTLLFGCVNTRIPDSVKNIADRAFSGFFSLFDVTIPHSVTSIGRRAFWCQIQGTIHVETGNKVYDSRENCNAIIESKTNILLCGGLNTVIPDSVTAIGDYAFALCEYLETITIPGSVTRIGNHAFSGCRSLISVTIPSSVTYIDKDAFSDCHSLGTIKVEEDNKVYDSRGNCNAIIDSKTNTLLVGCKNTIIPDDVTIIAEGAFALVDLKTIIIPQNVTSIDKNAFACCRDLKTIKV